MKVVHLEFDNCRSCPHADQYGERDVQCLHKDAPEKSKLNWEDDGKLPEWCPLPDLVK